MKISLTAHRYMYLLFLILSSQSIFTEFTDPRRSKAHPSNGYSSSFDSTPTYKKEFNDQDNQNDTEQNERIKISFLALISQATLNNHPIYIPDDLRNADENKSSEISRDIFNFGREDSFDVDTDISYAAAITATIATIAKRTLDATTVIPLALINAYKNKRLHRKEQELLEYDFDQIDRIINRRYKPNTDKLLRNNTVYSFAGVAGAAGLAAIVEGAVIIFGSVINNHQEEKEKQQEQSKQEQTQQQSTMPSESMAIVQEPAKATVQETRVVTKDFVTEPAKEALAAVKKDIVFPQSDIVVTGQKDARVASLNAIPEAVKACEVQRAYDQEKRDQVIDVATSFVGSLAQQYHQRQKAIRKYEQNAEYVRKQEEEVNKKSYDRYVQNFLSDPCHHSSCKFLMSYEQYLEQQSKKKVEECRLLREDQEALIMSKRANEIAFQNGRYTCEECPNPAIDRRQVDPSLKYPYGNGQRLLDLSSSVPGSSDRLVVQSRKVIKFTRTTCRSYGSKNNEYSAVVIEDFTTLSKKEVGVLWNDYNLDVTEERSQQFKANKKQVEAQKNKNNNSGPDKDPDKDPENKGKKAAAAAAAKKAKDELDKANKNKPGSQKNTKNHKPTLEDIRKDQCLQNEYTNGKGVYESNLNKHHENARKGVAKEPARPIEALKDSLYVDKDTRVAIQDREIVMLRKHGTTVDGFSKYHSYIESNINRVEDAKKVLSDAGLIHPKSGKIFRK